jgi:hypothetical protein
MQKINMARVVAGGLLAGVIISIGEYVLNMVLLRASWEKELNALRRAPTGNDSLLFLALLCFGLGVLMIWLYAAIRPRFGPGPTTAVGAAFVTWALAYLFPSAFALPMDLFPRNLFLYAVLWGLLELPIAALAGAWLYKE